MSAETQGSKLKLIAANKSCPGVRIHDGGGRSRSAMSSFHSRHRSLSESGQSEMQPAIDIGHHVSRCCNLDSLAAFDAFCTVCTSQCSNQSASRCDRRCRSGKGAHRLGVPVRRSRREMMVHAVAAIRNLLARSARQSTANVDAPIVESLEQKHEGPVSVRQSHVGQWKAGINC